MQLDLKESALKGKIYKLMSQSVIPRPIAWIVTEDEGVVNIAPFSYFIPLSSDPATLLVSIGHKPDGIPKDTLANLRKHGKCTICMVEEKDLEKMHYSSKGLAREESEAEHFNIETVCVSEKFPPMVKDAPVAFFCSYREEIALGGKTIPVILDLEEMYLRDDVVLDKESLDLHYDPVARVGKSYAFLSKEVEAPQIP
jgi:flavin reductase (DIM6/NTAB) family NADH-FMN oxidoreductase RutF